jgi:hypothetical protein
VLNVYPYKSRRHFHSIGRGGGVNEDNTWLVKTEAIGKGRSDESPYLIANEWICGVIAQYLRLPIPPFAIVTKKTPKTRMYISYSFDGDTKPDDIEPQPLYAKFPDICTGIVVFDIFVVNGDRHYGNLQVDKPSAPSSVYMIDHERALFNIETGQGIQRLERFKTKLGILGRDDSSAWHCLLEHVNNFDLVAKWVHRIAEIPDWFLEEACEEVWKVAITRAECDHVQDYLKHRRDHINQIIFSHKNDFPGVDPDAWGLFI